MMVDGLTQAASSATPDRTPDRPIVSAVMTLGDSPDAENPMTIVWARSDLVRPRSLT